VSAYRFESSSRSTSRVRTVFFDPTHGPKTALERRSSIASADAEGVSVVLDIAWREDWTVEMQVGSVAFTLLSHSYSQMLAWQLDKNRHEFGWERLEIYATRHDFYTARSC
jgi:hypothetical protein